MLPVLAGTVVAIGGWLLLGTEQPLPGVLVGVFGAALLAVRGFNDVQLKPPAGSVRRIVVGNENNTNGNNSLADLVATFDAAAAQAETTVDPVSGLVTQGRISKGDWRQLRETMWQLAGHDHPSRSAPQRLRVKAHRGARRFVLGAAGWWSLAAANTKSSANFAARWAARSLARKRRIGTCGADES